MTQREPISENPKPPVSMCEVCHDEVPTQQLMEIDGEMCCLECRTFSWDGEGQQFWYRNR